jgi:uncharacterized Zn-binding protein involved in type VI secretion
MLAADGALGHCLHFSRTPIRRLAMGKPAARVSDTDACPIPGHGPNPVSAGSPNVLINNLPSARVGDPTACGDAIAVGIPTILVNGKPIAHLGSSTAHGGVIVTGSGNVLLGNSGGGAAMSPVGPLQILGQAVTKALAPATTTQKPYSVQFRATDETSGEPVCDLPYRLQMADGTTLRGSTDEDGYTMRVNTAQAENVQLFWEPHVEDDDCDQHSDICGCD